MEVSGQLHAFTALPPGKESPVPIEEAGRDAAEKINIFPLPVIETRPFSP
jgi:hypothetical protein